MPGGLSWEELAAILVAIASGRAIGATSPSSIKADRDQSQRRSSML
jgi:hypothetical protein